MDLSDILRAHERLTPYIRRPPMLAATCLPQDPKIEAMRLFFKLESFQVTGSFKVRGALNRFLLTPKDVLEKGVVAASGGNHGRAVAYAARLFNVPAEIIVPVKTPDHFANAIRALGAKLIREGEVLDESVQIGEKMAADSGRTYIHGFRDPEIVAGAGTLGLEILKDLPDVDTVLVATGGGGLLSGISLAMQASKRKVRVIGVEPTGAPTLTECLKAGKIIRLPEITTKAGTLALRSTFPLNFELIRKYVHSTLLVSDEEMIQAAQWLWRRFGIASEMSAASVMAALLTEKYRPQKNETVCAIICGLGADGMAEAQH